MKGKYSGRTHSVQPQAKHTNKSIYVQNNSETKQIRKDYYQSNRKEMLSDIYSDTQGLSMLQYS